MDIATVVGLIAFVTALMVAIGSNLGAVWDVPSAVIVAGGALGLTMIATPLQQLVQLVAVLGRTVFARLTPPTEVVASAAKMAEIARSEGVLALEEEVTRNRHDVFLTQGIRLAVDGTEPDLIMDILETEVRFIEDRHRVGRVMVEVLGRNALVAGAAGTLVGVIIVGSVDGRMAPLLQYGAITLLYGLVAWGLCHALAHKLGLYSEHEVLVKRMAIEAVMAIQSGDNPRIVEHKLSVFLPPAQRPSAPTVEPSTPPGPPRDPQLIDAVAELTLSREAAALTFADLARMSDRDVQVLLRAIDQKALVLALKGAGDEVAERFLSNMSERVRSFLEEEMAFARQVDAELSFEMQQAIVQQVLRMARENQISLPEDRKGTE